MGIDLSMTASTAITILVCGLTVYYTYFYLRRNKRNVTVSKLFIYPIKSCKGISVSKAAVGKTGFLWDRWFMLVDERGNFLTQRQEPRLALVTPSVDSHVLLQKPSDVSKDTFMTVTAPRMHSINIHLKTTDSEKMAARVWSWRGHGLDMGNKAADWFSNYLGYTVRLLQFDVEMERMTDEKYASNYQTAFSDGFPYLVASQGSLDLLNSKLAESLCFDRFRPNILVDGCDSFEEDTWQEFIVGSESRRVFKGVKPCGRCKITTINQETGEVGSEPLLALKKFRGGPHLLLPQDFKNDVVFGMNVVCQLKSSKASQLVEVGDQVRVLKKAKNLSHLTPK